MPRIGLAWLWFVLIVVLPTTLVLFYTLTTTSPLYLSQTRFAIEDRSQGAGGGMDGMMASLGLSSGEPKSIYTLKHYLQSPDVLKLLEDSVGFSSRYQAPHGDLLTRLRQNPSFDELLNYYQRMVVPRISTTENIITLEVSAFDPETAQAISAKLLTLSEEFVNRINTRAHEDQVKFYVTERNNAEERLIAARTAVTRWRNQNMMVDPTAEVKIVQDIIASLEMQQIEVQADIAQLKGAFSSERQGPRIRTLELRAEELDRQMEEARKRLAGKSQASTAERLDSFERLSAEVELSQQNLTLAMTSVEAAQQVIMQQQRYLLLVTSPSLPSEPSFPRVAIHVPLVFLLSLILFGILMLFITIIRDYRSV